jgi:crossover junction endodeoxyribonuclease RuvC
MPIVVGFDPSLAAYGLALVDTDRRELLAHAVITTSPRAARHMRLRTLFDAITAYLHRWSETTAIDLAAFEGGFVGRGAMVALGIAEARGAGLVAASHLAVEVLSPSTAKMALTGSGKAQKHEVGAAVRQHLQLVEILPEDAADAAAIAIAAGGYRAPRIVTPKKKPQPKACAAQGTLMPVPRSATQQARVAGARGARAAIQEAT